MPPPTGRLAPTPSGFLHLGNARSFLLAWLWARSAGGRVIMRVEDIDLPRCRPMFRRQALSDLLWLGLDWDAGPRPDDLPGPFDQSTRFEQYRLALDRLVQAGRAYPCVCSRKDIEEATRAPHGDEGAVYPGTCRGRFATFAEAAERSGTTPAWRFAFGDKPISFHDGLQGPVLAHPRDLGDFVLWRKDGLPSYQIAVTVDDAAMGVSQVLRGRDLLLSTVRQLALYEALGLQAPAHWAHVPLLLSEEARRLAKRDGGLSLKALREQGVAPARILGLCAFSCGLQSELRPATLTELTQCFDFAFLHRPDFTLTREHLAWLLA
ncbi:MAG: tRNA glutamyl-Q(34) synthetase GluQRS [Planctomycetaceae bacterium]|nr:tRNA glutamyl-Q(34) synthetase GluQRS [Planctomycetaceae bacterium]